MKYFNDTCKNTAHDYASILILRRELDYWSQRQNTVVGQAQGLRQTEKERKRQKWTGHAWLDDKSLKCVTNTR
jgi:hypothetical protein